MNESGKSDFEALNDTSLGLKGAKATDFGEQNGPFGASNAPPIFGLTRLPGKTGRTDSHGKSQLPLLSFAFASMIQLDCWFVGLLISSDIVEYMFQNEDKMFRCLAN
tara:strand:- start:118 stop:438 length:321 start_codon:yes stop_codon:yes gene_type:complete